MRILLVYTLALLTTNCIRSQIIIKEADLCPNKDFIEIKNGHECVDLGLPSGIKWSTCNVGASSPSDFGEYFAWGEIQPKSEYSQKNYMYHDTQLTNIFDAVRLLWHGKWRMPTTNEVDELRKNCKWTQAIMNGHHGVLITGENGNSIFLPAAGVFIEKEKILVETEGRYWTSSALNNGMALYFKTNDAVKEHYFRSCGLSIRPVTK